jgi:hypothetical protein
MYYLYDSQCPSSLVVGLHLSCIAENIETRCWTVATLVARYGNEAIMTPWWSPAKSAFGGGLVSVAVKMFSHPVCFIKERYKICTLNASCKGNAAMNCITVYLKGIRFPQLLRVILS